MKATESPRKHDAPSKSNTISQLDGHMSLKDALKSRSNPDLAKMINAEIEQVEAEELVIARECLGEVRSRYLANPLSGGICPTSSPGLVLWPRKSPVQVSVLVLYREEAHHLPR